MSSRGKPKTPRGGNHGRNTLNRSPIASSNNSRRSSSRSSAAANDPYCHTSYQNPTPYQSHRQCQQERQLFRSSQASKQMVYNVYANVIGVLEEVECREQEAAKAAKLQRSSVKYADLSRRNNEDVRSQLDTQLLLFQTQVNSCAPEIKSGVRKELEKHTLKWISKRQECQLPKSCVDEYAYKLYQIVADGKTNHPEIFSQIPDISKDELRQNFQHVMVGEHDRTTLDKEFRDDPNKEAEMEGIREGSVSLGAERMQENFPETKERMEIHHDDSIR